MTEPTDETTPTTVAAVLDRIDHAWEPFAEWVQALGEEQLALAGENGWTVKDHLAHVAAWERGLLAVLERRPRHAAMGAAPTDYAEGGVDAVNAAVLAAERGTPAAEVLGQLLAGHDRLRDAVAGLDDGDLARPYAEFQPDQPGAPRDPVLGAIAGDTWEHYGEHLEAVRAVAGRPSDPGRGFDE